MRIIPDKSLKCKKTKGMVGGGGNLKLQKTVKYLICGAEKKYGVKNSNSM